MTTVRTTMLPLPADPRVVALLRVLRPEFREERFVPPQGHFLAPILCQVPTCPREDTAKGMCLQHRRRWRAAGAPEPEAWMADRRNWVMGWSAEVGPCRVSDCHYAAGFALMCDAHRAEWMSPVHRRQKTPNEEFVARAGLVVRPDIGRCRYPDGCAYPISDHDLCEGHLYRWQRVGKPTLENLPAAVHDRVTSSFSVTGLSPLLTLEFQYLLQVRTDQRSSRILQSTWGCTTRLARTEGIQSLRDRTLDQWRERANRDPTVRGLLGAALSALADLGRPEDEYECDVWRPERLGFSIEERRGVSPLNFTPITQEWLQDKAKRWTKVKLAHDELRTIESRVAVFKCFSRFLARVFPDRQDDPMLLDRAVLETYVGWLGRYVNDNESGRGRGKPFSAETRIRHLSTMADFFAHWHRYGWEPALPPTTRIYTDDYPRRPGLNANFIDEHLMDQIEAEDNLALLEPETRTMVLKVCGSVRL